MSEICLHTEPAERDSASVILNVTPQRANWRLLDFKVRSLPQGHLWSDDTGEHEACLVLLSGQCRIQWEGGESQALGPRKSVFESYPHAVYLPRDTRFELSTDTHCEIADGRVPSEKQLSPRLILPTDCGCEIRGGGNATRQIIDIIPPDFPADRLLVCEVFTPSGNWSSYPPHKHDVDNPPDEVNLEEVYYYRFNHPDAYGFQRVYTADGSFDETLMVCDGDLVLIREGYHPFVSAYGYDAYYLNFLAGDHRSMACTDDPRYEQFRQWPEPDPRLPVVPRP